MRSDEVEVQVMLLPGNEDIPLPQYQSEGAVAMDLHAAVKGSVTLDAGQLLLVPCGFAVAIPPGYELRAATCTTYRFLTFASPRNQVRRPPPVSHTWAKLRSTNSLRSQADFQQAAKLDFCTFCGDR